MIMLYHQGLVLCLCVIIYLKDPFKCNVDCVVSYLKRIVKQYYEDSIIFPVHRHLQSVFSAIDSYQKASFCQADKKELSESEEIAEFFDIASSLDLGIDSVVGSLAEEKKDSSPDARLQVHQVCQNQEHFKLLGRKGCHSFAQRCLCKENSRLERFCCNSKDC